MPRCYEQINKTEREYIALRLCQGIRPSLMGRELNRHRSTISRELRRNGTDAGGYYSTQAHRWALQRRRQVRRAPKLGKELLKASVERRLRSYWSPEQISGRRRLMGFALISRMTIYRHIAKHRARLSPYLRGPERRKGWQPERIHDRTMIDERPRIVEERVRVGDWESDTVRGPMASKACVATHVDRKSYYLVTRLLKERNAEQMNLETVKGMQGLPLHTLTVDNGMEFGSFKKLEEQTGAKVYFAHRKCPWQRARNENTNRLLRQFLPRGTDFAGLDPAQLRRIQALLNDRPRKALGYQTPREVMQRSMLHL